MEPERKEQKTDGMQVPETTGEAGTQAAAGIGRTMPDVSSGPGEDGMAEEPAPPSLAAELSRRRQRIDAAKADYERKRAAARELYGQGRNPVLAYIDATRPEPDTRRQKRMTDAAKMVAWSNFLSALGTGIAGMATQGYVPRMDSDAPLRMMAKANEWEDMYERQNREYRALRLDALLRGQQDARRAAQMDEAAAGQEYAAALKGYDALWGDVWKAQQAAELQRMKDEAARRKAIADFNTRMAVEDARGENARKVAGIRAAAGRPGSGYSRSYSYGAGGKPAVQFFDKDNRTVVSLSAPQEAFLVETAQAAGVIPADGTPAREAAYYGERVPQFYYGNLKPVEKANLLRRAWIELGGWDGLLAGGGTRASEGKEVPVPLREERKPKRYVQAPYKPEVMDILEIPEAERMRESGFSDEQILKYYLDYE